MVFLSSRGLEKELRGEPGGGAGGLRRLEEAPSHRKHRAAGEAAPHQGQRPPTE